MTRLQIDPSRCEGHGRCYDVAPKLFESDDYGHGQLIAAVADGDIDAGQAIEAMHACPEQAITFTP